MAEDNQDEANARSQQALAFRFELWVMGIRAATIVLCILAAALPLQVLNWMVGPFAGEDTTVDVKLAVSVVLTVSVVVNVLEGAKIRSQQRTIRRLRARLDTEERTLGVQASTLRGTLRSVNKAD